MTQPLSLCSSGGIVQGLCTCSVGTSRSSGSQWRTYAPCGGRSATQALAAYMLSGEQVAREARAGLTCDGLKQGGLASAPQMAHLWVVGTALSQDIKHVRSPPLRDPRGEEPVGVVRAGVVVEELLLEKARPEPPVDVHVLREERGDVLAPAVGHEPCAGQVMTRESGRLFVHACALAAG